jgi:hypothetical protein
MQPNAVTNKRLRNTGIIKRTKKREEKPQILQEEITIKNMKTVKKL